MAKTGPVQPAAALRAVQTRLLPKVFRFVLFVLGGCFTGGGRCRPAVTISGVFGMNSRGLVAEWDGVFRRVGRGAGGASVVVGALHVRRVARMCGDVNGRLRGMRQGRAQLSQETSGDLRVVP